MCRTANSRNIRATGTENVHEILRGTPNGRKPVQEIGLHMGG
jgi:hypothetical protein